MEKYEFKEFEEVATVGDACVLYASKVVLFNDNLHSIDEVVAQIMKAINCDIDHANKITLEAHSEGKAVVFEGELVDCLRVSGVLEEIELHTQIEY